MNTKNILIGIAGLLAIALFGGTASAQYREGGWWRADDRHADWFDGYYANETYYRDDTFYPERGWAPGYQREFYGRVLAVKTVMARGTGARHLVALITMYSGQKIVVDLGPEWRARRLALRPYGDRLWVTGEVTNVRGKRVIMARTARTEYRRIAIDQRDRRFYRTERPIIRPRPVIRDHRPY